MNSRGLCERVRMRVRQESNAGVTVHGVCMLVCCDLEQKLASWPLKSSQVKSVVEILRVKSSQVK